MDRQIVSMMLEKLPVNFWTCRFWLIPQNSLGFSRFPQNSPEFTRISQIMKWKGKYSLWCQRICQIGFSCCRKQCWRYLSRNVQTSLDKFGLDQNPINFRSKFYEFWSEQAIIVLWCQKSLWILLPSNVDILTWQKNKPVV